MASSFEELDIWKKAHQLTIQIYTISSTWPREEIYGLTSQVRRAAVSVELNISEGQARYHYAESIHFLYNSRGSIEEVRNCLMVARDITQFNLTLEEFEKLNVEYIGLIKGLNSYINYLRSKKTSRLTSQPVN